MGETAHSNLECFVARILVLHGPNLNLLGQREPTIYGSQSLAAINAGLQNQAESAGHRIDFLQSNAEHELVDAVQRAKTDGVDAILINPAAFTHTSVAILDALNMIKAPIIELHISNPHKREPFRHHSYVTFAATALICGLGVNGYPIAVEAMADLIKARQAAK